MAKFIDFRALRAQLDFARVLALYGVNTVAVRDQQLSAHCPFPSHLGVRAKPSFSADLSRGIWRCFGCKTSGNVLDFAVRMEGREPKDGAAVREIALKLQRLLSQPFTDSAEPAGIEEEQPPTRQIIVNGPLGFTLKDLNPEHDAVRELGLEPGTIAHFGLGYCARGLLKGRVAIPLHDPHGQLIGYAGRRGTASATDPLYLFPSERTHEGVTYRFDQSRFVYGAHLVDTTSPAGLIVADDLGFVWHLWERGVPAVAVSGDSITDDQWEILTSLSPMREPVLARRSFHDRMTQTQKRP